MDNFNIFLSILVVILSFSLPFFNEKISFKNPKSIKPRGWIYISIIFLIIGLSGVNLIFDSIKSKESDKYQKDTKTNTDTILNKTENSLRKLEIVSQRLENLNPRLDLLEEKTLKSINKIDSSLNLFDKYDSLQRLKILENEPKILIDSVVYVKVEDCYKIRVYLTNYGRRIGSNLKLDVHFFYIENKIISSDRNLTIERVNDVNIIPEKDRKSLYYIEYDWGCIKNIQSGFIQIDITYYDDLLIKHHSDRLRFELLDSNDRVFHNILKHNNNLIEKYIKKRS